MKRYMNRLLSKKEYPSLMSYIENSKFIRPVFNHSVQNNTYSLENKVALITGASSGIGKAIALELAKKGTRVVLAARSEDKLNEVVQQINNIGGTATALPTDVSKERQCKKLIEKTIRTFGVLDILINNAGISMRANFIDVELSVLKKLMETNFWGAVYCTKYALPYLLKSNGSLVGISSICGITPLPGRTGYAASKHALDGFLDTLRLENIEKGLHVLLVHPGFTASNIRNTALNSVGLPQMETPRDESKMMPAENVAKEVIEGIIHKKREITLTTEGRLIKWIYRRVPYIAERILYKEMKKEVNSPL